jgi:hypothetical protein
MPQLARLSGLHDAPEQQPLAQDPALQPLQLPASQDCPVGHWSQLAPPEPQAAGSRPGWQTPPLQQPAQEVGVHVQVSPTQARPVAQAGAQGPQVPSVVQVC